MSVRINLYVAGKIPLRTLSVGQWPFDIGSFYFWPLLVLAVPSTWQRDFLLSELVIRTPRSFKNRLDPLLHFLEQNCSSFLLFCSLFFIRISSPISLKLLSFSQFVQFFQSHSQRNLQFTALNIYLNSFLAADV